MCVCTFLLNVISIDHGLVNILVNTVIYNDYDTIMMIQSLYTINIMHSIYMYYSIYNMLIYMLVYAY